MTGSDNMYDDDYRDLIQQAHDAVRDLLDGSTHDSWLGLRVGYGQIRKELLRDEKEREHAEWRECRNAWKRIPAERRESLVLQVLGAERLIIRELASRMNNEMGWAESRPGNIHESDVRPVVRRMLHADQLERVAEPFKGSVRYRYFRKQGLDGPIAGLERAYHDTETARGA
jgi:hypothetical protein